jgi:fumarylpyruvate hydrolase
MRDQKKPWEIGKAFDFSAPISAITPVAQSGVLGRGVITCDVNGEQRQAGDLSDMIWPVADIIANVSQYVRLAAGDLIFTGTPEGVGPVVAGDRIEGHVAGVGEVALNIAAAE